MPRPAPAPHRPGPPPPRRPRSSRCARARPRTAASSTTWTARRATPRRAGSSPRPPARAASITTAPGSRCAARTRQASCGRCHTGKAKPATTCEGCHRDPHQGRHDGTCAECHTAIAWSDTNTLEQHRRTRMPLTGRHALARLQRVPPAPGRARVPRHADRLLRLSPRRVPRRSEPDPPQGRWRRDRSRASAGRATARRRGRPAFTVPNTARTTMALGGRHDAVFVLSTGSHRAADVQRVPRRCAAHPARALRRLSPRVGAARPAPQPGVARGERVPALPPRGAPDEPRDEVGGEVRDDRGDRRRQRRPRRRPIRWPSR